MPVCAGRALWAETWFRPRQAPAGYLKAVTLVLCRGRSVARSEEKPGFCRGDKALEGRGLSAGAYAVEAPEGRVVAVGRKPLAGLMLPTG